MEEVEFKNLKEAFYNCEAWYNNYLIRQLTPGQRFYYKLFVKLIKWQNDRLIKKLKGLEQKFDAIEKVYVVESVRILYKNII